MCHCSETAVEVQKQFLGCWQRVVSAACLAPAGPVSLKGLSKAVVGLVHPSICELAVRSVVWSTMCLIPALPAGRLQDARPALGDGQSCPSHRVAAFGVGWVSGTDPAAWTQIIPLTGVMGSASLLWRAGTRVIWSVLIQQVLPWGLD